MTPNSKPRANNPSRQTSRANQIAQLNDSFRKQLGTSAAYITVELAQQGATFLKKLLGALRNIETSQADAEDDERSYGAVSVSGQTIEWVINYYDRDEENESPDPADSSITKRTLTIYKAA